MSSDKKQKKAVENRCAVKIRPRNTGHWLRQTAKSVKMQCKNERAGSKLVPHGKHLLTRGNHNSRCNCRSLVPLACPKRQLNGLICWLRPYEMMLLCKSKCGTNKNRPCLKTISSEYTPKFCGLKLHTGSGAASNL